MVVSQEIGMRRGRGGGNRGGQGGEDTHITVSGAAPVGVVCGAPK